MQKEQIAIVGGTCIDGSGGKPLADSVVLVQGDRIAAAGPRDTTRIPAGAEQIDARGKYVLPGLIDLHIHMFIPAMVQGGTPQEPLAYAALYAANNLRQALQAGITTIRDMGAYDYIDLQMKRAIAEGVILGPRAFVSGKAICMTGGHLSQGGAFSRVANGPWDVRVAIREQVELPVKFICLGESNEDVEPIDPDTIVDALFS